MKLLNQIISIVKKIWFVVFILAVLLIYIFWNKTIALVLLAIVIVILVVQIIYEWLKHHSFVRFLEHHLRIDDVTASRLLKNNINVVRNKMHELMLINKVPGLIIQIRDNYLYYNKKMVSVIKKILIDKESTVSDAFKTLSKYGIVSQIELRLIRDKLLKKQNKSKE